MKLHCCGIESKDDFNETNSWNRTNPWWTNSMTEEYKNFKYPLTCCPLKTDMNAFQNMISCTITGSDIYDIVR